MKGTRYKKGGWYGESYRHYLAAKGVSTKRNSMKRSKLHLATKENEYFRHNPDKTFATVSPEFKEEYSVYLDNPGGDWLERKQQSWKEGNIDLSGSVTAVVRGPVDVTELASLPGANNEHLRMDKPESRRRIEAIKEVIKSEGPEAVGPGYIIVWPDGRAVIGEGNHRAQALKELGYGDVFWEIQYRGGGEDTQGSWSIENFQKRRGYLAKKKLKERARQSAPKFKQAAKTSFKPAELIIPSSKQEQEWAEGIYTLITGKEPKVTK